MRVGVIGWHAQDTNPALVRAWRAQGIDALAVTPDEALEVLGEGDAAVCRLDVMRTLDGVEPGLEVLAPLGARGVRILNPAPALIAAHDKLETAELLRRARIPHPASVHVRCAHDPVTLPPPVVVKPRFGSWGRDVFVCRSESELRSCLDDVWTRPWFRHHGALVQKLVPPRLYDFRLIVAGGRVVGGAQRLAAPGEWRTNVSLGGSVSAAPPGPRARVLALSAAAAAGMDLVGVDLLPGPEAPFVVLELNGAVDFDDRYALAGRDIFADVAGALQLGTASVGRDIRDLSA